MYIRRWERHLSTDVVTTIPAERREEASQRHDGRTETSFNRATGEEEDTEQPQPTGADGRPRSTSTDGRRRKAVLNLNRPGAGVLQYQHRPTGNRRAKQSTTTEGNRREKESTTSEGNRSVEAVDLDRRQRT